MNAEQHEWYWKGYNDAKKYESFPTQRQWVGLTDEEVGLIADEYSTLQGAIRAIEAKLKQNNQ
jgi:hypothetical protein